MAKKPNLIVILIDDLRFDETSASGHPYMKTPHIDRLAHEGAMFENAFHTTPLCSPNRASILTGQYASRHGIIDNVGRDAASHRLDNYHIALQALGYETAHVGKWHMGNDSSPRPGYDHWVSFKGQGRLVDPILWENGGEHRVEGYMTDILNARAVEFAGRKRTQPFALFFAHKAVHPDLVQNASGGIDAVLSPSRVKYLSNVPTAEEQGVMKGVRVQLWASVAFPSATPDPIVKKWEAAVAEMAKDPAFLTGADRINMNIDFLNAADMRAFVEKEVEGYTDMAGKIGIRR